MSDPNTTHGAPSWLQHASADPASARDFYERVLGWAIADMPMQDGSSYAAITVGDRPVGGFAPISGDGGWTVFITVDDVDARVAKAKGAGADIAQFPMTAPGVGRMATIVDPFGGRIALIDYTKA